MTPAQLLAELMLIAPTIAALHAIADVVAAWEGLTDDEKDTLRAEYRMRLKDLEFAGKVTEGTE